MNGDSRHISKYRFAMRDAEAGNSGDRFKRQIMRKIVLDVREYPLQAMAGDTPSFRDCRINGSG